MTGLSIKPSKEIVILGISTGYELKFDEHVNYLWKKTGQKLNVLTRIAPFMDVNKKKSAMKAFESQFGNCPLIWMFHSKELDNRIKRIHERALRITYNYKLSSFGKLLNKNNSVTIHYKNNKTLAIEIYKVILGLSPPLLNEVFMLCQCSYDLQGNFLIDEETSQWNMALKCFLLQKYGKFFLMK